MRPGPAGRDERLGKECPRPRPGLSPRSGGGRRPAGSFQRYFQGQGFRPVDRPSPEQAQLQGSPATTCIFPSGDPLGSQAGRRDRTSLPITVEPSQEKYHEPPGVGQSTLFFSGTTSMPSPRAPAARQRGQRDRGCGVASRGMRSGSDGGRGKSDLVRGSSPLGLRAQGGGPQIHFAASMILIIVASTSSRWP